jgi:hypothetical protein
MVQIKKMSKELEEKYYQTKQEIKSYEVVSLSSRASKGSVANAKNNYSKKERQWFDEFKEV